MKMAFPTGEEEKFRMLSSMYGQVRKFVVWRAGALYISGARALVEALHGSIDNVTGPRQVNRLRLQGYRIGNSLDSALGF